jgi:beta-glucanase (GH16 family)
MNVRRFLSSAVLLSLVIQLGAVARAAEPKPGATKDILELKSDVLKRLTPQHGAEAQVSTSVSQDAAAPGLVLSIKPGNSGYPGVDLKPKGADKWDLSAFGHVEARVVNTSDKVALFALRVDGAGDWRNSPWNTEQRWLKPGEAATITVIFGYHYDHKPGYALNPKEVVNILLFTNKADAPRSFRIESLVAAGPAGEKPPVDPAAIRIKPKNGIMLGSGVTIDPKTQIETKGGAQGSLAAGAGGGQSLKVVFPAAKGEQSVALKSAAGRWDLRDATEVRVKLKNEGSAPVTPSVQVTSNNGPTDLIAAATPLAAGAEREIVVPFAPVVTPKGAPNGKKGGFWGGWENLPGTGTKFVSDAVAAVKITAKHDGEAKLLVESITAAAPPAVLPDWLGKRPPVPGDWVKTFDEEFDGPTIDQTKWNIYGPNYWDKASHWSKDNLIIEGGMAKFRFEKKRGFHNDNSDPNVKPQNLTGEKESDYACGYLDTYGKWVQRYGYFEARVKLPRVPGLWPTFWMMPDRGVAAGEQWVRGDTGKGGMELDILEHLTRWGPYRYNIALHWDGYGKEHQSIGSTWNYVQADKDGFITPGMLWTPGLIVYYCNGKELWRWEHPRVSNVPSNFIFEVTTGGWDNDAVDDKQLPADYLVDYVRVWQRKDLASSADGVKPVEKK